MNPPGTVAVIADEVSRFSRFSLCLAALNAPPGSKIRFGIGRNIAEQTNRIIETLQEGHEWVWLQGDDHVFFPSLLNDLLAHNVDVVVPLVTMRHYPFHPVVFSEELEDGQHRRMDFSELPESGLIQVHAAGSAGMLIRKRVLDAIEPPWADFTPVAGGVLGEDLSLCRKIRNAGFPIHVDLGSAIGHLSIIASWPKYVDGQWAAEIDFNQGAT